MNNNENKKNNIYKNLMIIIITALITCILTTIVVYNAGNTNTQIQTSDNSIFGKIGNGLSKIFNKPDKNATEIEKKITEINKRLRDTYIGEIDDKTLVEGALKGYVASVGDDYTEYLTEKEINQLKEEVNGSYVGIGVYITQLVQSNEILVIGVIKDSPAKKARNIGW